MPKAASLPRVLRTAVAGLVLAAAGAEPSWGQGPKPEKGPVQVIKETTDEVVEVLRNAELDEAGKQERVIDVVNQRVDVDTVCKLVLARNYPKFSSEQLDRFIREFRRHLLYTYWNNAQAFDFQKIEVTGDRKEARKDWTVKTLVYHDGDTSKVDYRLRLIGDDEKTAGEWKVIDILIEGVSLVSTFRSEFQSLVQNKGIEGLLELLREKNDKEEKAMKEKVSGGK